jgi:hypothetical protein
MIIVGSGSFFFFGFDVDLPADFSDLTGGSTGGGPHAGRSWAHKVHSAAARHALTRPIANAGF